MPALPATMKALELRAYGEGLVLVDHPLPRPARGEVLVKIAASPINPSDLMFLRGLYVKKKLPIVPGFEASGTVVAAGGGLVARALVGRRVACAAPPEGDGTWAEYTKTSAALCIPLLPRVDLEAAAMLIANPLTAVAMLDVAKRAGAGAIVQTAAASALGQMFARLALARGVPMIHVVRRRAQVDLLRTLGATHVLDSSEDAERGFDARLAALCRELDATVAFDAVAGAMTGRLLAAMPRGSRAIVYGALSEQAVTVAPGAFIMEGKSVEGFWLSTWLRGQSLPQVAKAGIIVQRHLSRELRTQVRARMPLDHANEALAEYTSAMTGGKVLLTP